MTKRTQIGGMQARDFDSGQTQALLETVPQDEQGYVRFACMSCPRTGKVAAAKLRDRFAPTEGLVNILNVLKPKDCPRARPDPWGNHRCGWCYRDLGQQAEP